MIIHAEVLGDHTDEQSGIAHRGNLERGRPVHGMLDEPHELGLNRNAGNGTKPLRTWPEMPVPLQVKRSNRGQRTHIWGYVNGVSDRKYLALR